MTEESDEKLALEYFERAYARQRNGELEEAIELYKKSIAILPTAVAHTFLGWTYSFQSRYDDAIAECHRAIAIDPDFGNPYNDIGAYLIEKGTTRRSDPVARKSHRCSSLRKLLFPALQPGTRLRAEALLEESDGVLPQRARTESRLHTCEGVAAALAGDVQLESFIDDGTRQFAWLPDAGCCYPEDRSVRSNLLPSSADGKAGRAVKSVLEKLKQEGASGEMNAGRPGGTGLGAGRTGGNCFPAARR